MKKLIILTAGLCFALTTLQAQKMVYKDANAEGEGMTAWVVDPVSTKEYAKFKIKITNKSDHIILFDPNESVAKVNGKDFKPDEKLMRVEPGDAESKVINFKGADFMAKSYSYTMDGLYKISGMEEQKTADYQLPPTQNTFKTGNFTCTMLDMKKESDKTHVKFSCRYTGDKIGIINPASASTRLPDGTEVANTKSKAKPILLKKGESEDFSLNWDRMAGGKAQDMQKITMMIVWKNTFEEAEKMKLKPVNFELQADEAK